MLEIERNFGERLREERIRLSFTQEKLAESTNVRPLSISQYENGHSAPSIKFIYALGRLGFDLLYIMLATRKENIEKEFSPEIYRRVAKEISLLELKLGEGLEPEMRVKVTNSLLNYFGSNPSKETEQISTAHLLTKMFL